VDRRKINELARQIHTLVLLQSHRPSTELKEALAGFAGDLHVMGDCRTPRTAEEAVYEELMAGLAV
jgi:hypothetical protein